MVWLALFVPGEVARGSGGAAWISSWNDLAVADPRAGAPLESEGEGDAAPAAVPPDALGVCIRVATRSGAPAIADALGAPALATGRSRTTAGVAGTIEDGLLVEPIDRGAVVRAGVPSRETVDPFSSSEAMSRERFVSG